jgi:hypothetical protein
MQLSYYCASIEPVNILILKMTEVTLMKLKTKVNSLNSVGCKCYRPGDPEFETVASLVTPLHKIRSEFCGSQTLYHEEKASYGWKRNESVNDLYVGDSYLTA